MQVSCRNDLGSHVQRHVTAQRFANMLQEPPTSSLPFLLFFPFASRSFPSISRCRLLWGWLEKPQPLSAQDPLSHQCIGLDLPTSSPLLIPAQTLGAALPAPQHERHSWVLGQLSPRFFFVYMEIITSLHEKFDPVSSYTCKLQMKSSNAECFLSLLRRCLAQRFAVTLSPQNEVRWTSDEGQKAALGVASCKGVLGTGSVGAPSDGSHPNSIIFLPKQCSKLGVLALTTELWVTWWKEGAESQAVLEGCLFFGGCMVPLDGQGPCQRGMMPCWPLGAWHRQQGKMQYFIHMCWNLRSCYRSVHPWGWFDPSEGYSYGSKSGEHHSWTTCYLEQVLFPYSL